jgi:PAS domain-containing protein
MATALNMAKIDIVSKSGVIVACDPDHEALLGFEAGSLIGASFEKVYALSSRKKILDVLSGESDALAPVTLNLRDRSGGAISVSAIVERFEDEVHGTCARIYTWKLSPALVEAERLREDSDILSGIVAVSEDPFWCIEFLEPVDLSAPEQEAVRQIFENRRRWRFCNAAMAKFYRVPDGMDLNDRPVGELFPCNPENEQFARDLIKGAFDVVGCLSLDTRYDGAKVEVENDVRGYIKGSMLHRMWGTVRDVSKHIRRQEVLKQSIGALEAMLAALPDPFLVVDTESGMVLRANLAAERLFGRPTDRLENDAFDTLVGERLKLERLSALLRDGDYTPLRTPVVGHVRSADGPVIVEVTAQQYQFKDTIALAVSMRRSRLSAANADALPMERVRGT